MSGTHVHLKKPPPSPQSAGTNLPTSRIRIVMSHFEGVHSLTECSVPLFAAIDRHVILHGRLQIGISQCYW